MSYTVRPISDRTAFTGKTVDSQFTVSWSQAENLLLSELRHLKAREVVLEIDLTESQLRLDGRPRSDAKAASPAVRLAFETNDGPQKRRRQGRTPLVIHLGDHDPSGIDMTRDIRDRLSLMSAGPVEVRRIALTMDQIEQYDPPPNPAKFTDARAASYVEEYGDQSWELDALEPSVLTALIQDELATVIDAEVMNQRIEHETEQRDRLVELAGRWTEIDERWQRIVEEILDES